MSTTSKPAPCTRWSIVAPILTLLAATAAQAQPLHKNVQVELTGCAAIEDDAERLRCYDAIAREPLEDNARTADSPAPAANETELERQLCMLIPAERWEFEARRETFKITPYRPNYILPVTYNWSPNQEVVQQADPGLNLDKTEVKFQLSAKSKVLDDIWAGSFDLWLAYTQQSYWQMYNTGNSSPFRETNYEPEVILSYWTEFDLFGLTGRYVNIGFSHQSNGRSRPLSRSWNRLYAAFGLEKGNFALELKPWYRIPENDSDDDNPDIHSYLGYGEINCYYRWDDNLFGLMLRNNLNLDDNRGAVQFDWAFPIVLGLSGYVQYFNGYGESLLDYNASTNRLGIGIMLTNWL